MTSPQGWISATARAMTWLVGRLHDEAVASAQIGDEPEKGPSRHLPDGLLLLAI